jgi:hypothetical protein
MMRIAALAVALAMPVLAHPVSLDDAKTPPDYIVKVKPGKPKRVPPIQCDGGYFWDDIQAYKWDGTALPAQRETGDGGQQRRPHEDLPE